MTGGPRAGGSSSDLSEMPQPRRTTAVGKSCKSSGCVAVASVLALLMLFIVAQEFPMRAMTVRERWTYNRTSGAVMSKIMRAACRAAAGQGLGV